MCVCVRAGVHVSLSHNLDVKTQMENISQGKDINIQ